MKGMEGKRMDRKYQIELLWVGKWEHGKQDENMNWKLQFKKLLMSNRRILSDKIWGLIEDTKLCEEETGTSRRILLI